MKVHFGEEKPKYIRFEGNDMFVSFDSIYWIYYGTFDENGFRAESVEITGEMVSDFWDCKKKAETFSGGKDCDTCSWNYITFGDVCACELEGIEESVAKEKEVEEMKIIGNKESVNQISLTHKGINARFNCFMKPFPYCNDIDTSNPEIIKIIFQDSYEIDNLIDVLEKFKKECFEHLGEWR